MDKNEKDESVVHCSLMGMGKDHLCYNFGEKKCKLCQLSNMYNNAYSWIANMVDNIYTKEPGVDGLFIVLTPKKGLALKHKGYVEKKLADLYSIREMINEIENENI